MSRTIAHATDQTPTLHQKLVTAICGMRVPRHRANPTSFGYITCVGCRAILAERTREALLAYVTPTFRVVDRGVLIIRAGSDQPRELRDDELQRKYIDRLSRAAGVHVTEVKTGRAWLVECGRWTPEPAGVKS